MKIGRRQFLGSALVAPALLTRRTLASSPDAPVLDRPFARATKEGQGLFVTLANPAGGPQCLSNGGVLAGRDAVLLIEGHMQPAGATFELDLARLVSNRPIRGAVNTHFHPDHAFGDSAFSAAKIPILAQDTTPALIKSKYETLKAADKAAVLRPYEERIAAAHTDAAISRAKDDLGAMVWMFTAIQSTELTYPTELLSIEKPPTRIDLGGLTAVLECHRGHTPTDVVVRVPERDVLFVGDLLFHREYPVCIDADMVAWRKVLEPMAAEPASVRFVPGHGPICDRGTVREFIDVLDDLQAHAAKMIASGAPVAEAEDRYAVPAAFSGYPHYWWDWRIGAAMRSYYATLKH
jgi:glyoxylase-like metal-dependent hydrolase (beta-lactamase superfamily II)